MSDMDINNSSEGALPAKNDGPSIIEYPSHLLSRLPSRWIEVDGRIMTKNGRDLEYERHPRLPWFLDTTPAVVVAGDVPEGLAVYYYEFTITRSDTHHPQDADTNRLRDAECYHLQPCKLHCEFSAGFVLVDKLDTGQGPYFDGICSTTPLEENPFFYGDTIGCGIIFESLIPTFFLTRNGKYLGSRNVYNLTGTFPKVTPTMTMPFGPTGTLSMSSNFGQSFMFDVTKFHGEREADIKELLSRFLEDILEEILEHAISQSRRVTLHRLSSVCRRWRRLCLPHLLQSISLRNFGHARALPLPSLDLVKHLSLTEAHKPVAWFHSFAASRIPREMTSLTILNRTFSGSSTITYNDIFPPHVSRALPALTRAGFAHVQSLVVTNYRYSSWSVFAQTLLCFPRLSKLSLRDVRWEKDDIVTPPQWMRSHAQLQIVELGQVPPVIERAEDPPGSRHVPRGDVDGIWHGFVWLFLIPRTKNPVSIQLTNGPLLTLGIAASRSISQILRTLSARQMVDAPRRVLLKHDDSICALELVAYEQPVVRFEFEATEKGHKLRTVFITLSDRFAELQGAFREISGQLGGGDDEGICRCVYDLAHVEERSARDDLAKKIRQEMKRHARYKLLTIRTPEDDDHTEG